MDKQAVTGTEFILPAYTQDAAETGWKAVAGRHFQQDGTVMPLTSLQSIANKGEASCTFDR